MWLRRILFGAWLTLVFILYLRLFGNQFERLWQYVTDPSLLLQYLRKFGL